MIFDKAFFVRWKNYPPENLLLIVREKDSHWLYVPRHAIKTGNWTPFKSLKDDIATIVDGKGEPEIVREDSISMQLTNDGQLKEIEPGDENT